ncbi:MAG TPA: mechanosensitive ion channel family protein [Gaiellaceae bacterium]
MLPYPFDRLLWGAAAIVLGVALGRTLRRIGMNVEARHADEERELARLRRAETVIILLGTAIPYVTSIVVIVVLASIFLPPAAALGGSALLLLVVGFAAQRFLMDIVAGMLIVLERWYGVGDFVMVEPAKAAGVVEQFGLRTTVIRSLNGDRVYAPNSQIIAAVRSPRGYRRYSIELLVSDPDEGQHAIERVARRAPTGEARFLRSPEVVEVRELGEGTWLVRGHASVAPTMEWLAESFLPAEIRARAGEYLLADPIVYTIDEEALSRYQRRVLVR